MFYLKLSPLLAGTALSLLFTFPASAQEQAPAAPPEGQPGVTGQPTPGELDFEDAGEEEEIVVTGARLRGSVIGDIPPENRLDPRDIRATGAADVTELLEALGPQIGSARGRGGERPILLLNGQRISGFRELRDIPTEAIQRVEILPEEVALRYGYRADQRVVNFVLRPRFRSTAARVEGTAATQGGYLGGEADTTRLMIGESGRTTATLRAEGNDSLSEAERDIALGTDPGRPDERAARTLIGSRRLVRGTATVNRQLPGEISATLNAEVEHSDGRSLLGLSDVLLEPLVRDVDSDSAHLGAVLNGNAGRWRWSATGNADLVRSVTFSERADDTLEDRARTTRTSADADMMANGPLFTLPAGEASATLRAGASALHLDASRRRAGTSSSDELGRTRGFASANLDLPVSRRNSDFEPIGNLTLNANAELEQLSDFGSLATFGAGVNWSPVNRLNLLASWTLEQGAPTIQQLGDPPLETPGSRIFDFTRGETAIVTAISGGNPDLLADRRSVFKLGGNWQPFDEQNLRIRAEYVRSRLEDPVSSFPGATAALEAAFPERFERDAEGRLVRVDLTPVNYDEARRDTLRWGFDFSKPLQSRRPSQEQIERFRRMRGTGGAPRQAGGPQASPGQPSGDAGPPAGGPGGGFGGGGFGGGQRGRGGRLQLSVTHTLNLVDEVTIREGLPELDYLAGDTLGQFGGRPRHELEAQAGWSNNGLGARLSANWRSGTEVESATGDDLRFSPHATFDLRLFANLGQQFALVERHPWLRGSSVRLEVDNIFDSRPRVRDGFGAIPAGYQPDLLEPLGRTVSVSFRKLFLPPRSFLRQSGSD